ncbi:MAG: LapA family protein [Bacillota bacterium]
MQVYLLLAMLFALFVSIFAVQNSGTVAVRFLVWRFGDISLVLVILGSAVIGALFVFLLSVVSMIPMRRQLRSLQAENHRLTIEIGQLGSPAVTSGSEQCKVDEEAGPSSH